MSALNTIYTNLAAKSLTGITLNMYSLTDAKKTIETAQLPCRILLPISPRLEATDGGFIHLGTVVSTTWRITDLMLWAFVDQGLGLQSWADDIVTYCAAYVDMLRTFRAPADQCILEGWSMTPGVFEYPASSGRWYAGVEVQLEVKEVLSG